MFKKSVFTISIFILGLSGCATNHCGLEKVAHPSTFDESLEKMFELAQLEKILNLAIEETLAQQVKINPNLEPLMPTMRVFFEKYMSWQSLKPEMSKLYKEAFTKEEIDDLIDFYSTTTGQKLIEKNPELMQKGMQIGSERVQQNMNELKESIRAKMEEIAQSKAKEAEKESTKKESPAQPDGETPSQ